MASHYSCNKGTEEFETYLTLYPLNTNISPDFELGVTFDGKDYRPEKMANRKIPTGKWIPPKGNSDLINTTHSYRFSLFLIKRTLANSGKDETIKFPSKFNVFSIGKGDGTTPGYDLEVTGMGNIRYIPCTSIVSINPGTINFGNITSFGASAGKEIKRVPFNVFEQRTCNKPSTYGLNGRLKPLSNSDLLDSFTLVPKDNPSVSIEIIDTDGNNKVGFDREFVISPKTDTVSNTKQFEASLKWRTDKPSLGEFNAGAVLDIFYK